MSVDGWNTVLVLGGIRSGKSEFAESLMSDAGNVRYVVTAATVGPDDPEWAARIETHQGRRPESWATEETGTEPSRLARVIAEARPDETLLVDDLGGWVTVLLDPAHQPADDIATIAELAAAIRDCAARLVLVSPEVGFSLVPQTPLGRAFADALGSTNQAVATACDAVVLVVAGQAVWLKPDPTGRLAGPVGTEPGYRAIHLDEAAGLPVPSGAPGTNLPDGGPGATVPSQGGPAQTRFDVVGDRSGIGDTDSDARPPAESPDVLTPAVNPPAATAPPAGNAWTAPTMMLPMVATGLIIQPGMELPLPDEYAGPQAVDRLATLDVQGAGLGNLERVVGFAARTQGTPVPTPWRSVRVLLLHGDHDGGAAAGVSPGESDRRAGQARAGEGALARLAAQNNADLQVIDATTAAPIEHGPALSEAAVESALRYGWRLAEEAADAGVQLLVLASVGTGTDTAAAAVLAATAGAEPAAVLGRVIIPGGQVDDRAWMIRAATVRDALHRTRRSRRGPRDVLAELAGGDIAIATGILLGATARRLPVLLDGPVGVSAALVSRDLAGQARHWCLLPDHGSHPAVRLAADVLGLTPLFDLRVDLGEGATALAALPLLRNAVMLAGSLPAHPRLAPAGSPTATTGDDPAGEEFAEPEPAGPGPAAVPDEPDRTDGPDEPDRSTGPAPVPPGRSGGNPDIEDGSADGPARAWFDGDSREPGAFSDGARAPYGG